MHYFKCLLGLIRHPYPTIQVVAADARRFSFGYISLFLLASISGGLMLLAHFTHATPVLKPFLDIPQGQVFLVSFLLVYPVTFLGAILFAGLVQLVAQPFGGTGNFEQQWAMYAFAYPPYIFLFILIPEILMNVLGIGHVVTTVYVQLYFLLIFVIDFLIVVMVVRVVQGLTWARAALCGFIGYATTALMTLTYIR